MVLPLLWAVVMGLIACEGERSTSSRSLSNVDVGVKSVAQSKVIPHTEDVDIDILNGSVSVDKNTFNQPVKFDVQGINENTLTIQAENSQSLIPTLQKDIKVCLKLPEDALDGAKVKVSKLDGSESQEVEGIQTSKEMCIQTRRVPGVFTLILNEKSQLGETLTYQKEFAYGSIQMTYDTSSLQEKNIYFIENSEKSGVMEGGILGDDGQEVTEWFSKSIEICWSVGSRNISRMTFFDWDQKKTVYTGSRKGDLICFAPGNFVGSFVLGPEEISTISTEKAASLNATPVLIIDSVTKGDLVSVYTDAKCEGNVLASLTASANGSLSLSPKLSRVGAYQFYVRSENLYGAVGSCSQAYLNYTLLTDLSAPTGLSLISPSQAVSFDVQPVVQVDGVEAGAVVNLYSNANCQNLLVSAEASSSSIQMTLPTLSEGDYVFYAKTSKAEIPGNCSQVSLSYKVDVTNPVVNQAVLHADSSVVSSVATTFDFDVTGANEVYITEAVDCSTGGTWETYQNSKNVTLPHANASNTLYVQFRDEALNKTACLSDTILHDNVAPTSPSVTIVGGIATSTVSTNLTFNADDAHEMYVTNTSSCSAGGIWESYASSKTGWTLGQTNATATVYVKYRDIVGNETSCVNDAIIHDDIAPSGEALTIDGGVYTADTTPNLTFSAVGADEMYITNTSGCSAGGTWESYGVSKENWSLGQTDAVATVYVKYRDHAGNESSCVNDTIVHDSTVPSNESIVIDGGTHTSDGTPDLTLAVTGATEMYITNTLGCSAGGVWESYATTKTSWTLGQTNAIATVYVKFRNAAGTEGSCVNDTITHDDNVPTSTSIVINGGTYTSDGTPDLTLAATGASEMYITNTSGCSANGTWESYATSKAGWTLGQSDS
ncbi:MAG: hypothetical protein AB8C84_10950, partial [Oligoflexales bacterium]